MIAPGQVIVARTAIAGFSSKPYAISPVGSNRPSGNMSAMKRVSASPLNHSNSSSAMANPRPAAKPRSKTARPCAGMRLAS